MAIALSGTSPAAYNGAPPGTTATFAPPANSLLVVCVSGTEAYSVTNTVSDSVGGSYSNPVHYSAGLLGTHGAVDIFTRYLTTAPGNMTITVSSTFSGTLATWYFKVLVLTGCDSGQSGIASGTSNGSSASSEVTLTPNFTGSWIVGITDINASKGFTRSPVTNFTEIDWHTFTSGSFDYDNGCGANETGPSGSTVIGWTFSSSGPNSTGALEIKAGGSPVTVNLTTAQVNVAAISPVVNIGGKVVELPTAQVNVAAPAPTISTASITSGGQGTAGNIKITYVSPSVQALAYSISPKVGIDSYGNQVPIGYQGPLSAIQPGSNPVVTETWHSLSLTNCAASGNGANGFFYRYRGDNEVELVWDITLTSTSGNPNLVTLPAGYLPAVQQNLLSSWYGTGPATYQTNFSPHLLVFTSGIIQAENCLGLTTVSLCGRTKITLDTP